MNGSPHKSLYLSVMYTTMKRLSFCLLLLFFGKVVFGQTQEDTRIVSFLSAKKQLSNNEAWRYLQTLFPEWDLKKMQHICMPVGDRTQDVPPGSRFTYTYQQCFYEAARVDINTDTDAVIAQKIAAMWKVYEATNLGHCNGSTFDVRDGSLLKYAVADKFDDFLNDAIKWKLHLNKVDASDNMTLLDYVDYHITRTKGTALEIKYQQYYNLFRKAGAKHKREL
jgi:hypothetical protein